MNEKIDITTYFMFFFAKATAFLYFVAGIASIIATISALISMSIVYCK